MPEPIPTSGRNITIAKLRTYSQSKAKWRSKSSRNYKRGFHRRRRRRFKCLLTSSVVAYDLYIRAKALLAIAVNVRTKENLMDAVRLLDEAVARDPKFLIGYCYLASAHDQIYLASIDHSPARLASAQKAVDAALILQPDSGEAHLALAEHLYCGYLDYDRAREELDVARKALPNEPRVFELTSYIDRRQSRWTESLANLKRASESSLILVIPITCNSSHGASIFFAVSTRKPLL